MQVFLTKTTIYTIMKINNNNDVGRHNVRYMYSKVMGYFVVIK